MQGNTFENDLMFSSIQGWTFSQTINKNVQKICGSDKHFPKSQVGIIRW